MEFTQAQKSYILDHQPISKQQDKSVDNRLSASEPCTLQSSLDGKDLKTGLSNPAFDQSIESFDLDKLEPASQIQTLGNSSIGISLSNSSSNNAYPIKLNETEESEIKTKKEYNGLKNYWGIALAFIASFCFSLVILFVKILHGYGFEAYGATFWRYVGTVLPTIPLFLYFEYATGKGKGHSISHSVYPIWKRRKTWLSLLNSGVMWAASVIFRFYALDYLTIGDTMVITYSTPVLVTVLAHCFLGEKCGIFPIIIAFVTLIGVVIVSKPPLLTGASEFDSNSLIGICFACGSLLSSTMVVITTRQLRSVHFTIVMIVIGIMGMSQALVLTYWLGYFKLPTGISDSLLVAGISGLSFIAEMSLISALKFEDAGPVSLIRCCDVIFGFIFQYVFLHVVPDIFSTIGAVIVLTGVLSIGFRKWLSSLPQEDSRRKKWGLLLK